MTVTSNEADWVFAVIVSRQVPTTRSSDHQLARRARQKSRIDTTRPRRPTSAAGSL